ncbi:hypothetical protein HispidOSU_020130, partial [Sigmodon hispidus]
LFGIYTKPREAQSVDLKYNIEECRRKLGAKTELSIHNSQLCKKVITLQKGTKTVM